MIQWWQVLLLTLYAGYQILDELQINSSAGSPIFAGFISGLVMGDMATGLEIGAALQLTILGVGTFGGASRIDANSGAVLATAFAVAAKMDPEVAVTAIGVPVAALLVYTDILGRFSNVYFAHLIDGDVEKMNYRGVEVHFLLGALPWALSRMIPVGFALAFGGNLVNNIVEVLNGPLAWLGAGLGVAGAVLPAVGFAILLRNLPVKQHFPYLILGFTITSIMMTIFSNIQAVGGSVAGLDKDFATKLNGFPMLAAAMLGLGAALIYFNSAQEKLKQAKNAPVQATSQAQESADSKGEILDDEL